MISPRELVVTDDAAALALAVARHVAACARDAISARGRFNLALAGGSTPKAAYALLASGAAPGSGATTEPIAWDRVHFFFGDERCVPPADDQSNFKMANDTLLAPLSIPPEAIFRMRGEDDPVAAAAAYANVLRHELPRDDRGTPVFDLIMLGMGPDGHTASLFPGSDPYNDDDALVRAPFVEKFATFRLTVTPRILTSARNVAVAAGGESKAAALAAVFAEKVDDATYPIAVLHRAVGQLTWFVDRDAAARLPTPSSSKT